MTTIGILETGSPPAPLAERYGAYPAMFRTLLGEAYPAVGYDVVAGEWPERPDIHRAWIVTGSAAGVYDDLPWIPRLIRFLQDAKGKAKLVGICFGHQVMAEAFGGRVAKSDKGWGIGLHRYDVHERASWMDDATSFAIPVSHQDQVIVQPPRSRVLAGSSFNGCGLIAYEDQPAISFQCHPEFEPAYAQALIAARRAKLSGSDAAIASLEQPNDRARVAEWIRRFLDGEEAESAQKSVVTAPVTR